MKTSSFLAAIGVGLFILNHLFSIFVNTCSGWRYEWYIIVQIMGNVITLTAWILIGQFFITLYRRSK